MSLFVIGLNHKTAPISLRERLAADDATASHRLRQLCHPDAPTRLAEAALLSTCNRVELFGVAPADADPTAADPTAADCQQAVDTAIALLAAASHLPAEELRPHLYQHTDDPALAHLMRVATGLDSLVLGEAQILGQVRAALELSTQAGTAGPVLRQVFQRALRAGKRARAETEISRQATSTSHVAVQMAARHLRHAPDARVLVMGAGEMAALALKTLQIRNFRHIGCVNRTFAKAQALAQTCDGTAFDWADRHDALAWADVVIAATGAPVPILHPQDISPLLPARGQRPLVLIDISLPRNIHPDTGALPGVIAYDIDDLQATLDANLARRRAAIPAVEEIIREEQAKFSLWKQQRAAVPTIVALRQQTQQTAAAELDQALAQLSHLPPTDRAVVERLVHRLTNKFLHQPTVHLRANGPEAAQGSVAATATALFGLAQPQANESPAGPPAPRSPAEDRAEKASTACENPNPALCPNLAGTAP